MVARDAVTNTDPLAPLRCPDPSRHNGGCDKHTCGVQTFFCRYRDRVRSHPPYDWVLNSLPRWRSTRAHAKCLQNAVSSSSDGSCQPLAPS